MSFKDDIEVLVGSIPATVTDTDIGNSLTYGAKDVIKRVMISRPEDAWLFSSSTAVTASGLDVESAQIVDVSRGNKMCNLIPASARHQAADTNSLMYSTAEFPSYYYLNGKIFILPEPGAGSSKDITEFATYDDGNKTKITATGHGFSEGDQVIIAQSDIVSNDTDYVGGYYVYDWIDANNFIIEKNYEATVVTGYSVSEPSALCQKVTIPTIAASASSVAYFPSTYYGALIAYGAMDVVMRQMSDVHTDSPTMSLPTIPVAPNIKTLDDSVPTYTPPSLFVPPAAPEGVDVNTLSLPSFPTYENVAPPVFEELTFPISQVSISAIDFGIELPVPPESPSFSDGAANFTQPRTDAPTYTKPVFAAPTFPTMDDIVLPELPVPPNLEFAEDGSTTQADNDLAEYIPPVLNAPDWTSVEVAIVDEDPEMVTAKLAKVQAQISEYQSQLQAALNNYQRDFSIYEKKFAQAQGNIQGTLTAENQKNQSKLAIYSSELQSYQMECTHILQEWDKKNVQERYTKWANEYQNKLQEYTQDISQALNQFQAESTIYQSEIQKSMQDATNLLSSDNQEYASKLNKHAQEIQLYTAKTSNVISEWSARIANVGITEFTTKRNDAFQEWNTKVTSALGKYNAELSSTNQKFNNELQAYQSKINERIQIYQAETGYDIQLYSNELNAASQRFQSDMSQQDNNFKNELENFTRKSGEIRAENQEAISLYNAELQAYSSEASTLIGEFNANIQSLGQEYQWYLSKLQTLQARYESYFVLSPAGQQQQKEQ